MRQVLVVLACLALAGGVAGCGSGGDPAGAAIGADPFANSGGPRAAAPSSTQRVSASDRFSVAPGPSGAAASGYARQSLDEDIARRHENAGSTAGAPRPPRGLRDRVASTCGEPDWLPTASKAFDPVLTNVLALAPTELRDGSQWFGQFPNSAGYAAWLSCVGETRDRHQRENPPPPADFVNECALSQGGAIENICGETIVVYRCESRQGASEDFFHCGQFEARPGERFTKSGPVTFSACRPDDIRCREDLARWVNQVHNSNDFGQDLRLVQAGYAGAWPPNDPYPTPPAYASDFGAGASAQDDDGPGAFSRTASRAGRVAGSVAKGVWDASFSLLDALARGGVFTGGGGGGGGCASCGVP